MISASHELEDARLNRLCHDLRQYVATGLLLSEAADGDPGSEAYVRLGTIHTLFRQIGLLINAEVDGASAGRTPIDLPELVSECTQLVALRDVEIETRVASTATAYGDAALLRRAVANVLDNALRAARGRGSIRVRVTVSGPNSVIEVTDDGIGFGRGPRGSGHGMSVVAMAVDACRGRLEIVSGPGPGTTVRMVLPRYGAGP